ncbi:MAG TPA: alpha/beta family hydrolase [Sporichthyaceae bacterium]
MSTPYRFEFATPTGPARAEINPAGDKPTGVLVLGHGAGGGIEARDLHALAVGLPDRGITVIRVEQPWRAAGRKVAAPPRQLDVAWIAVLQGLRAANELEAPLVVGGRSAGARVACRTARELGAVGCLALAFPLHPPGRPGASRVEELLGAGVDTLVVQGERDPFGGPAEFPAGTQLIAVPEADHGFRVPARAALGQAQSLTRMVAAVGDWLPAN